MVTSGFSLVLSGSGTASSEDIGSSHGRVSREAAERLVLGPDRPKHKSYQVPAARTLPLYAKPEITPMSYVVKGTTAATKGVALLLGIGWQMATTLRR